MINRNPRRGLLNCNGQFIALGKLLSLMCSNLFWLLQCTIPGLKGILKFLGAILWMKLGISSAIDGIHRDTSRYV